MANTTAVKIWDLLEEYKENGREAEHRADFAKWREKYTDIVDKNESLGFKTGDVVNFLNGYDIPMRTEILGFDGKTGKAYMLWDCYWFPVDLVDRQAEIFEN